MGKKVIPCFVLCVLIASELARAQNGPRTDQRQALYSCRVEQIPTSWSFDNPPGEIKHNGIVFGDLGLATLDFRFYNLATVPIEALVLVMEYIDSQGKTIDRVPVAATTEGAATRFQSPFAVEGTERWKATLSPGDTVLMGGVRTGTKDG